MKNKYQIFGEKVVIFVKDKDKIKRIIIDRNDFETVNRFYNEWKIIKKGKNEYCGISFKSVRVLLHQLITNKYQIIDHINQNPFDNRRLNLRIVNKSINALNSKKLRNSRSRYVGVYWNKNFNGWNVRVSFDKKEYSFGVYRHKKIAIKASDNIRKIIEKAIK